MITDGGNSSHHVSRFTHPASFREHLRRLDAAFPVADLLDEPLFFSLVGTSDSDPSPDDVSSSDDGAYEKWLVRILLTLAFGLAFGIEGMTLLRSYLFYEEETETQSTETQRPVLQEGGALVPAAAPGVRVRRLRVQATDEAWTFMLTARPDTALAQRTTLTFDRLTADNGTEFTTPPRHTWMPSDTASFDASWTLPVGQRPDALTVTATVQVGPDSTASATRTMDVGHVPVRMQ